MKFIELFGVPGVGKTTLYNRLLEIRGKEDNWITAEEAKIKIAKSTSLRECQGAAELLALSALRVGLLGKYKLLFAETILRRRRFDIFDKLKHGNSLNLSLPYQELLSGVFEDIATHDNVFRRSSRLSSFLNVIKDLALFESSEIKGTILFQEGLVQKHIDSEKYFGKFSTYPDGGVHCKASLDIVVGRLRKRLMQRGASEEDINDESLPERKRKTILNIEKKAQVLGSHGVRVLTVDTEDSPLENAKKINSFMRLISE